MNNMSCNFYEFAHAVPVYGESNEGERSRARIHVVIGIGLHQVHQTWIIEN